jgi:hypothetical protein
MVHLFLNYYTIILDITGSPVEYHDFEGSIVIEEEVNVSQVMWH